MNAIVLAAGYGTRTNLEYPKQLLMLGGKPLFVHSLNLLKGIKKIDKIIVTVIPDMTDHFIELTRKYNHSDVLCVPGGKTRQESVYNALSYCDTNRVLIQAASRPFVTKQHILDLLAVDGDVVIPAVSMITAVYHKDGYFINRDKVLCVQLPQIFNTEILKKAHQLGKGKKYAEDSGLVYGEMGISPVVVKGLEQNIKITLPRDIEYARMIFNNRINNKN